MKCTYLIAALCLLWICEARHLTGCRDMYVWIADGSVDCKYLYTPSFYGLHIKPAYFCLNYPLTYCCDTCADLGYGKGSKKGGSESTQTSSTTTTTSPLTTTATTTTNPSTIVSDMLITPEYIPVAVEPARLNAFEVILQELNKL